MKNGKKYIQGKETFDVLTDRMGLTGGIEFDGFSIVCLLICYFISSGKKWDRKTWIPEIHHANHSFLTQFLLSPFLYLPRFSHFPVQQGIKYIIVNLLNIILLFNFSLIFYNFFVFLEKRGKIHFEFLLPFLLDQGLSDLVILEREGYRNCSTESQEISRTSHLWKI